MTGKVIIVTGASRGIGFAVAQHLLENGHKVLLVSRSEVELQNLKKRYPDQAEYTTVDLTNTDHAPQVIDRAIKAFGRLNGIVLNHGVLLPMQKIADADVREWKKVFDGNFFSALALAKASIPYLRQTKGRIILTSSGAATSAYTAWGPYGASKAAANSLIAHIAVEEPEIIAIAVTPGRVDTGMQQQLREHGKGLMADKDHASFMADFDQGRLNKPEIPGGVLARLAVDAAPELSGKYFKWDGPELAKYRENGK